jgi:rfaE bifunctional protein nucleotidyltransferase chain/domain
LSNENIIIFAGDHNGVTLKSYLCDVLREKGFTCIDIGPYKDSGKVDYVDYANQLSRIVGSDSTIRGVLICGTGVGMSIAANRNENIRAALVHNIETAPKCREHNDSNVLCLGSWATNYKESEEIILSWIDSKFAEGRHVKRVEKLSSQKQDCIVFANGVFDIIHTGHVDLLKFAKSLGDKLVVAINSDKSVKKTKGENRPINSELDRKKILEAISEVDEVIIFEDLIDIRSQVKPDIVVKGGEWTVDEVRSRDEIEDSVSIKIFPIVKDYSTTNTIKKIYGINSWQKKS